MSLPSDLCDRRFVSCAGFFLVTSFIHSSEFESSLSSVVITVTKGGKGPTKAKRTDGKKVN